MTSEDRVRTIAYALPVFDEADGIRAFHAALTQATTSRSDLRFEFCYVDDGSRDSSLAELLALASEDHRVRVLSLSRNYGHQVALTAALDHCAHADAVILMDTDLQDPPRVSLELISAWEAGADVAYAQRRTRQDNPFKKLTASLYSWALSRVASIDIPRDVGDFRLLDRRVVAEVVRFREHNRFLRGIVSHAGFTQRAVPFDRDARLAGDTGYPLHAMLKLAADGVLGFSSAPLRLISRLGYLVSLLSVLAAAYVLGVKLFFPERAVPGWAFLGVGIFLLGGIQLIMMGVIGSYVGRIYVEVLQRPLYSVALDTAAPPSAEPHQQGAHSGTLDG